MDGLFTGESVNDYYCRKCQRRKDISSPKAEFEVEVIKWFFRCWLDTWHDLVLYNARLLPFSLRTSVPNSGWHRLLPLSVTCQCHMITLVVPIYLNLELMNFNCLQFPPKSHLHPFFFPSLWIRIELNRGRSWSLNTCLYRTQSLPHLWRHENTRWRGSCWKLDACFVPCQSLYPVGRFLWSRRWFPTGCAVMKADYYTLSRPCFLNQLKSVEKT